MILGIGNTLMGDDGVGPVVARACVVRVPDTCDVVIGETAGMALIPLFLEGIPLLVIDAIDVGAEPGEVFRFKPDDAGVTGLRSNTLHGCGLPYLITTARLRGCDPDVTVYGVQVGNVMPDPDTLSVPVADAVEFAIELVVRDARRIAGAAESLSLA